jgi:hypothetical protein
MFPRTDRRGRRRPRPRRRRTHSGRWTGRAIRATAHDPTRRRTPPASGPGGLPPSLPVTAPDGRPFRLPRRALRCHRHPAHSAPKAAPPAAPADATSRGPIPAGRQDSPKGLRHGRRTGRFDGGRGRADAGAIREPRGTEPGRLPPQAARRATNRKSPLARGLFLSTGSDGGALRSQ